MSKLNLSQVPNGVSNTVTNINFGKIEKELNENVLKRRTEAGEDNTVHTDIDMNSNRIYNLPKPESEHEPLRRKDVLDAISATEDAREAANKANEAADRADSSVDKMEEDFQDFLLSSGYQDLGDYEAGLEITARNQIFRKDGELYRAGAVLEFPYTTTGDWSTEGDLFVSVGDAALRQDLANPDKGAAMVARGVVVLNGIKGLAALSADQRKTDQVYQVTGFYADTSIGGGTYRWNPSLPKSTHNGGTIIDPERAAAWSGLPADLVTLFQSGEGSGCFELTSRADVFTFGASDTHDSAKAVEQASKFLKEVRNDGRVLLQSEARIHSCWLTGAGEYLCDVDGPTLVAVEDGVYLHGLTINGMGIPRADGLASGFSSDGNDNIGVDQCHFVGFKCADVPDPELPKIAAVHINEADNVRITNNRVDGGGFRGLYVRMFKDAVITGNIVSDCENTGIQVYGERDGTLVSDRCVIANNIVHNIRSKNSGIDGAIHCYTSVRKLTVTGNVVENFDGRGIDMDTTSQCIIANNVVTVSPVSWDNPRYPISGAIRINRRAGWWSISPDGAIITGNSVFIKDGANIKDVIRVLGDSTGPIISNNNLTTEEGITLVGAAPEYIRVTSSSMPLISGNRIVHRASSHPESVNAILVDIANIGPADGAQISNNTITSTGRQIYIVLKDIQGAIEMIGNTLEKCSLQMERPLLDRCIVKSNTFVDHLYAIFTNRSPEGFFEISGNTFARAAGSGVEIAGGTLPEDNRVAIITRNVFCANDTGGPNNYQIRARLPCTISHNTFIKDGMSASNTTGDIRVQDGCIIHSNDFTRSLGTIKQDGTGNQILDNITLTSE